MPNPTPFTMPDEAREKILATAAEDTRGYYTNVPDDERAEEGLPSPPATAKPTEEPPATPETEPEADAAAPPVTAKAPQVESDPASERLFDEIAELRTTLEGALKKEPEPVVAEEDPLLAAALESDDPMIAGLARKLQETMEQQSALAAEAKELRIDRQEERDNAAFDAVQRDYEIDGKPMTDAHVEQVEDWIKANPEVGRRLTIEQIARVVLPSAVKAQPKAPERGPAPKAPAPNGGAPVATIVDVGTSGGAPAKPFVPRANETIESAMNEARKRFHVRT